jgi:hypothetical protein
MAKELVIRNGFVIYSDNVYSDIMTGITNDLDTSAELNELATASSIKAYVDASAAGGSIADLSDTTISVPELTGQTLVWDSGSWINTGISYFYSGLDSRYVNVDGDTMTGNLTVPILSATTSINTPLIDATTVNATDIDVTNITGVTAYLTNLEIDGNSVNAIQIDNITAPGDNNTLVTTSAVTSYIQQELSNFSTTLSGLTDTTVNNPQAGDILVYQGGTEWTNTASTSILGDYYTKTEADDNFVDIVGDTMTGSLIMDTGADITLNQGDLTLSNGDFQVVGNTTLIGDLYVSGTTTSLHVKDLDIGDNIITLNSGETGSGVTLINSGLKIDRGVYDPYYFIYNEATETFRIGSSTADETQYIAISGDTQAVATREDDPIAMGIAIWNELEDRFDTDIGFTWNTGTSVLNIDGDITITGDVDGVDISDFYDSFLNFTGTTNTLENLNDTTVTTPADGEILVWLTSTEWTNTGASYLYGDLDSRYVNVDGDTMTGNLTVPILSATTSINTPLIDATTVNATDVNTDNLTLLSGITVWSIQNSTGQTSPGSTLLTETAVVNLISASNTLGSLSDVTLTSPQTNDILLFTGSIWENTGQSYLSDLFVEKAGDTMTGDLTISTLTGTGDRLVYVDSTGKLQETDEYIYKPTIVSAGVGTTTTDTIATAVTFGTVWHYYVEDGTNYRSGIITAVWGDGSVQFNETSTRDIGNTNPIDFDVVISGTDVILQTDVASGTWNVKVVRMVI